jgi:hypothetical protein
MTNLRNTADPSTLDASTRRFHLPLFKLKAHVRVIDVRKDDDVASTSRSKHDVDTASSGAISTRRVRLCSVAFQDAE